MIFILWFVSHKVCTHIEHFFRELRSKLQTHLKLIKRRSKVQEKNSHVNVLWILTNESIFRKLYANDSLIMACLQIYRELLWLVTFLRVYLNSKEISYLPWQNTYPNLKTTCHIKLKFFLRTKVIENLLLAKYLISVTVPLKLLSYSILHYLW